MSTEPNPPSDSLSVGQQRRQANILLLRLQWLFILLLAIALAWLYVSQQRFENRTLERLQNNEQVVTRLNEMDDRLFAISQQTVPVPIAPIGNQAQNQLDLLRIQMQAANRLLTDNNYSAAIDLLKGLQWQLSQSSNEIAPALTIVIKQSLSEDIEHLQARSAQPSQWQLQNLAIQDIQAFLHSYESHESAAKSSNSANSSNQLTKLNGISNKSVALSRRQLTIHEVIMTLNLAIQASNMREPDQLKSYLSQARLQLQTVAGSAKSPNAESASSAELSNNDKAKDLSNAKSDLDKLAAMKAPANITEVIAWLDQLLANTPTAIPLLTTQVLDQRQK